MDKNDIYGLIGYPLTHSFSKQYFENKFKKGGIKNAQYELFPLDSIEQLPSLIQQYPNLIGLNVTIPYKLSVMEYLDEIDETARAVGAVNVIKIENGKLIGYNSDIYGFEQSLLKFMDWKPQMTIEFEAFVLGTGGASKAVSYVLTKLGLPFFMVSRKETQEFYPYFVLQDIFTASRKQKIVINTTPVGMSPNIDMSPKIPYKLLKNNDLCFDLIYNPEETAFMQKSKARGARVQNGLEMLHLQAERAWEIWNG